ncbi:hypothetical protein IFM89_028451 [Coptis chinensis]|uniref:PTC1-like winged helix-turn-helix domain-containing protein n=1 Tax=Coptis chinensis TaxID=261450 RepID=A0A835M6U2_9MAGN|nr:hypothetical protein IFM89_028451 [Coptis chinensis]
MELKRKNRELQHEKRELTVKLGTAEGRVAELSNVTEAMPEDNNKTAASLTSFKLNESTFIASLMPKKEIVAGRFFFESNPQFDGRGVIIAVFDSGVDPAADGLKLTSDGKPKILDVLDWQGMELQKPPLGRSVWPIPDRSYACNGLCWSSLNCSGLVHWGVRRKVTYLGRNSEKTHPGVTYLPSRIKEEEYVNTELKTEVEAKRKQVEFLSRVIKEEEDDKMDLRTEDETKPKKGVCEQEPKFSYGRWTKERYKSGELLMMQILKKKGAVFGKPVPRQTLRVEARKDIGDIGFLDHLLKHMIGKVAPNGEDMLRRCTIRKEQWCIGFESADLVNVRKKSGVKNPY